MGAKKIGILIYLISAVILFAACRSGGQAEPGKTTASFRKSVGEGNAVVYLGKPRDLGVENAGDYEWTSSDNAVASVENGVVTGKHEGLATIAQLKNSEIINEWALAVTTFNDGRQAELSYELGEAGIGRILSEENCFASPEYLKQNINTIQDVITYLQLSGFTKSLDNPIMARKVSDWYWCIPGNYVIYMNKGCQEEVASIAGYLLADDFEDWGYIVSFGYTIRFANWFYEDGLYYVFCFGDILKDFENGVRDASYTVLVTDNTDDISKYITEKYDTSTVLTSVMFSAEGHDHQPAYYFSYIHDSSRIYHEHSVIALEDNVLEHAVILFSNKDFDFELKGIPVPEIPAELPVYGRDYEYVYK